MNKDVIYIDVDDDVTAIIGKLKASSEKIVALVPPKRAGALQSAVNLRLLDRMAKVEKKKLVLVTNNQALIALAASAKIPVAKNLQSKPEIAQIPALVVDDGDDIIDGASLPIGDHAKTAIPVKDATRDGVIETIDIEDDRPIRPLAKAAAAGTGAAAVKKSKKNAIPNFDRFRKKLFLGIAAGVLLIGVLVWAFVFAPAATVIITARTSPAPVSATVQLAPNGQTSADSSTIRAINKELKKDATIEFDATGTGRVGENATGSVTITRTSVSTNPLSVPAGTRFTSGSISFVSTQAATLGGTSVGPNGLVQDSATVPVRATDVGSEYNVGPRTYQSSVGGISSQGSNMSGGSSREVKVVSASDVERARGDLIGRSTDTEKQELSGQFSDAKVIDGSFNVQRGSESVSPAVNQEASSGKATLTIPTTYSMYGVESREVASFLDQSLKKQIVNPNTSRVYDNGADKATLGSFSNQNNVASATLTANGQIGPQIDENQIKEQVKGKIFGEVQSTLQSIQGVENVDVRFSYFWVRTVPNNPDKIDIEFKLDAN